MEVDYNFQAEYAKSGRSGCLKCKTNIPQNSLRIAILVQAPTFDGKIPRWFHFQCFFGKNTKLRSTAEIKNFDSIRWEDQERIRKAISDLNGNVSADESKFAIKLSAPNMDCTKCKQELLKERHMIVAGDGKSGESYHLSCFSKSGLCTSGIDTLKGFSRLKKVDQKAVLLAQVDSKKENGKRPTADSTDTPAAKKAKLKNGDKATQPSQDALKAQSKLLWKLRDNLEREVSKDALIGLLEYNEQFVPTGVSNLLDAVADAMLFGALTRCPSCKAESLHYKNGQYKCGGMVNGWTPCLFTTQEPKRVPFNVPKEYHDVDFLRTYKYKERKRLFDPNTDIRIQQNKPLSNHTVYVVDGPHRDDKTKEQLSEEIRLFGATLSSKLTAGVIVLSSPTAWEAAPLRARTRAESLGLRVVSDELVGALKDKIGLSASQVTQILVKHTISTWQVQEKPKESERFNSKLQDDVMRVKLKGGAAVDPESGLDSKATVLRDSEGTPMTAVLGMVDLVKGYNSYYRLQALKHDSKSAYWVFRAWGRIGTSIGGTKLEKFLTESAARQNFEDLYLEKTGNLWCNRKNFEKVPHRFYEMELDYTDVEEKSRNLMKSRSVKSKLHPLLQALLEFICDLESMKNAMVELEIDVKKMPLGKLSKRQIQDAYSVLAHLSKRLNKSKQLDQGFVLGESNRFYTLIPHDFGMKVPPLLDNTEIIKNKLKMLEDLREIELAYNILKQDLSIDMNPLDQHYRQLNTQLQPVNTNSDEFARIEQYVKLTHGSTHTSYKLEVVAVFDVERADEKARYDGYTAARHNRQLLWHGSRRTNWVGILSQGLRIAPPEAPATGYMFGKGIYFADMVSKSANYCFTSQSQPEGLLLLCEVILGNMHECTTADASPLPSGKQSRKGLGSTQPDPSTYYTSPDGVIYPIGKPQPSNVKSTALLYNEYIVYDMAQVLQKYLVRVKFVYK